MENNKETIIAFVRLACSLVASGAAMFGCVMDADALFVGASCVVAVVAYIWSWWKNNNVTSAAKEAQEMLNIAKSVEVRRDEDDEWADEAGE